MRKGEIGCKELLKHFQVPGEKPGSVPEHIYVLGSFERRVTLYSQQVRALNLVYALFEEKRLETGSRVVVIGGGASGVTAAVALAHRGASVYLIERADVLLPLQSGCRTRWLHPRIYDWPEDGSEDGEASLPLIGWKANYAHEVAATLEDVFRHAAGAGNDRIHLTLSAFVKDLSGGERPRVSWEGKSPAGRQIYEKQDVDAVIVAVGFGLEEGTKELPMTSYWRNDDIDQPVLKRQSGDRIRCLVSGNGDGGLIEVLRLRIRRFRLEKLHENLQELRRPELERLVAQVCEWESKAEEQDDAWLWEKYNKEIDLPTSFTDHLRNDLRQDTEVFLAAASSPISFNSAILNRLWVALLVKYDPSTRWIESATQEVRPEGRGTVVTFVDPKRPENNMSFDRAILRHGSSSALTGALKWIADRCGPVLRPRNAFDETRWPIWKDETFGPSRSPNGTPVEPPPVMPALPATRRTPAVGGTREPPDGVASRRAIEFIEHCRVDPESVRSAAGTAGQLPPELHWHRTIQRALDLVQRSTERLDDLVKSFPWFQRGDKRHLQVPAFKRSFLDTFDRLRRAHEESQQGFQKLWGFLCDASTNQRTTAVRTFASLASLRMIARLRDFEGMIGTNDNTIVNFFPELPPIKSSWLLRRVPYRSRIGGLALGEESFLLCRIGMSESSYDYYLLPKWIAELWQEDHDGISRNVYFQWIVPQWFFYRYEGVPPEGGRIWVLTDEDGRERWSKYDRAPWEDGFEIEEEPHPSISRGVELEIEPGWYVLTLPPDAEVKLEEHRPVRPPLVGRQILWVDDHPDRNVYEMSYLEQLGARVSRAASTEFALSQISIHEPDLIISDLCRTENGERRELAGLELWRQLQDLLKDRPKMIPVIFYTGDRDRAPREIRSTTTDQRHTLFQLVKEHLAEGAGIVRDDDREPPLRRTYGVLRSSSPRPCPRRRLFSMIYDSPYQARCFDQYGVKALGAFRARMRLDALLWNRLVLTDAQLLDGRFFQSIMENTNGLLSTMALFRRDGAAEPFIEVRSRATRVEDALVGLLKQPGQDTLKEFRFSLISDEGKRKRAAGDLACRRAADIGTWRDIPRVLREVGVNAETTDRMRAAWAGWIAAQDAGWLRLELWPPTFRQHLPGALEVEALDHPWCRDLGPEARHKSIELFERRASLVYRTAVYQELDEAAKQSGAPDVEDLLEKAIAFEARSQLIDDFLCIRAWYDRGYNRALAWQNDADLQWISDGRAPYTRVEQEVFDLAAQQAYSPALQEAERRGALIVVPVNFMELLRDLSDKDFHRLVSSNQTAMDHLQAWYREGRISALRVALDPLIQEARRYKAGESVAEFSEATQIAVRHALQTTIGFGTMQTDRSDGLSEKSRLEDAFELDHVVIDESLGVTTQKVVESFDRSPSQDRHE